MDLCFKIGILPHYRVDSKTAFPLYNYCSAAIRHFYLLNDLGNCSNLFQVFDAGILNIAVFLRNNTDKFIRFIGVIHRFDAFIASNSDG